MKTAEKNQNEQFREALQFEYQKLWDEVFTSRAAGLFAEGLTKEQIETIWEMTCDAFNLGKKLK